MADNSIALFPIADLLLALGAHPGRNKNTFHSPFREDRNASLHIDPNRNVWFDHGAGIGGGNIDLVMKCRDCSAREAVDYILSLSQAPRVNAALEISTASDDNISSDKDTPSIAIPLSRRILIVRELRSPYLLDYIVSRGIPVSLAARYCNEVIIRGKANGRSYDNIGFWNNNGGIALKSPSGFKSTTKAGITTIDMRGEFTDRPTSGTVTLFEGFFDFLTWLAKDKRDVPSTDVVVLNSVANLTKAIPYLRLHDTAICCLDNDEAGRSALETLKSLRRELRNPTIIDGSLIYHGYDDLNDWWIAMKDRLNK